MLNWTVQIIYWVSSIGLALWACSLFDKVSVLPSPSSIVDQLWLFIVLFLYAVFNKIEPSRKKTEKRISSYITKRYLHFRIDYEYLLENMGVFQKVLLYSIMIYEDFNRPKIARLIEKIIFYKSSTKHTYGIMQVSSNHYLTDEESIAVAKVRIKSDYNEVLKEMKIKNLPKTEYKLLCLARKVAQKYNPEDPEYGYHVGEIFGTLYGTFYSKKDNPRILAPVQEDKRI